MFFASVFQECSDVLAGLNVVGVMAHEHLVADRWTELRVDFVIALPRLRSGMY